MHRNSRLQTNLISNFETEFTPVLPSLSLIRQGISIRRLLQRVANIELGVSKQFAVLDLVGTDEPLHGVQLVLGLDFDVAHQTDGVPHVDVLRG